MHSLFVFHIIQTAGQIAIFCYYNGIITKQIKCHCRRGSDARHLGRDCISSSISLYSLRFCFSTVTFLIRCQNSFAHRAIKIVLIIVIIKGIAWILHTFGDRLIVQNILCYFFSECHICSPKSYVCLIIPHHTRHFWYITL